MTNFWNSDRVAKIRELAESGCSSSQIADAFGGMVSRNAIIGQCSRRGIKLLGQNFTERAAVARRVSTKARTIAKTAPTAANPLPDSTPIGECPRIPLIDATHRDCRFPMWGHQDIGAPDFHVCGRAKADGPYCAEHHKIAFQRQSVTQADRDRAREAQRTTGINRSFG